ncbi:WXG100 family type VII secretion target [Streptomyces sp. NPDC012888]|uniref:WXG100 family type VII secretion target n=1 Tax=Streptomyces sp. NPDC012888 TaxID=3364855 RepID=UPI0036B8C257
MATNFEGYSHQDLVAMLASVDAGKIRSRGQLLKDAEVEITKIGNDLKNHKVEDWEGEAADSFQNWVNSLGNATLRLGEYSKTGGEWMVRAADTVSQVKAHELPAYDQTAADNLAAAKKHHNDPDSAKISQESTAKLNADRLEAARALKKVAESYEQSYTQINAAPIPTFPPAPSTFVPAGLDSGSDISRAGGGGDPAGGAARGPSGPGGGLDPRGPAPAPEFVPGQPPTNPGPDVPGPGPAPVVPAPPDRDIDTDLDTVGTLPPPTTAPPVVTPPPGPGPGPAPHVTPPPITLPPTTGLPRTGTPPTGQAKPVAPPMAPSLRPPGMPGPGGPGPLGKVPGPMGAPPRDPGIHGGRAVNTQGPTSAIPRGTVVGNEPGRAPAGRPGMAGGFGAGMGAGPVGAQGGPAAGRRLATQPGGIVGGRPVGAPGGVVGARPFTQGGSGLVRGGVVGGAAPAQGARREETDGGERPDYLTEDEATWQSGRRVAPPVID